MLARKMKIKYKDIDVGTTPMLLPSFSSRINRDPLETIKYLSDVVAGPFLISAYDSFYTKNFPSITFPQLIFLDSGGYECSVDSNISEIGLYKPESHLWNEEIHLESLMKWTSEIPTVVISYDHPSKRESIDNQINSAKNLFRWKDDCLKELLLKPETSSQYRVDINTIIEKIDSLREFDIIGFTEKELGTSVFERMKNIATLRNGMEKRDFQKPIHIFGSLDPITTPLYYFSGADIFDGLSWLRFAYDEQSGTASYIDCVGPKKYGIHVNTRSQWLHTVYANYNYLGRLELDLKKFRHTQRFDIFGENEQFFKKSYDDLSEAIGGF